MPLVLDHPELFGPQVTPYQGPTCHGRSSCDIDGESCEYARFTFQEIVCHRV